MENDWEQVKNIFQAVIERPEPEREQFLAKACRGNPNLSDEVRGLLDSFEENDSFFERAAISEVAEFMVGSNEKLNAGAKIGRYQIKAMLGAGGMGEVFLAEDTELERNVALKILSGGFSSDGDRVFRFMREAKSASALNHPNILTIHEIGQNDDVHFIATEYIKGETLRQRQQREPLNLTEILDITIQVAFALNAAHEAKIIHRDIKPENIMIREDGLVKVLDFGLAKLVESNHAESFAKIQENTTPGLIMGTIAYMSPEQTRGKQIDARTDIWSLGVCLYEMTAGFKPFAGETISDTIASIIKSEPLPLESGQSPQLISIIRKALQKDVTDRYQNTKDLLNDLKDLRQNAGGERQFADFQTRNTFGGGSEKLFIGGFSGVHSTVKNQFDTAPNSIVEKPSRSGFKIGLTALAAFIILTVIGTAIYYLPALYRQNSTFETMRFARLTFSGKAVGEQIAVSPDGKYAAFVTEEAGNQSLWVKHLPTSGDVRIVAPARVVYGGITFSRDGNFIYYSFLNQKDETALYQISIVGGDPRKIIDNIERPIGFSPDGEQMAFVQNDTSLMIADSDGGNPKLLATAQAGNRWNLAAWSPDGKTIVATVFSSIDNHTYLVEVSVADGTEKPLDSPPWLRVSGIAWLADSTGLIISGRDLETKLSQIWEIGYPDGKIRRITNDLNSYFGMGLTADGKKIVSIQYGRISNVWLGNAVNADSVRQITFDKDKDEGISGAAAAPDGKIVYTAKITGTQDLWIINSDGNDKKQLTFNARANFSPNVSPDNRYVVFISDRSGSSEIWRIDIDGGNPKQLTAQKGVSALPVFSPDGKWIIYQFTDSANEPTVWKIRVDGGGDPVRLTDKFSGKPVISPDGQFFACYYGKPAADNPGKIAIVPFSGGQSSKTLDLPAVIKSSIFRWTPDGKGLIYIDNEARFDNLWSQPLDGRAPKQLTNFKSEDIFRFDLSGDQIVFARGHETSDVITLDNFR